MSHDLKSRFYTPWQLVFSYWQSEHRITASAFLIAVIVMTVAIVGLDLTFSYWTNAFYDALQDYDKKSALQLLVIFMFLATCFIVLSVYRYYLQQFLALRWRKWLTQQFLQRWLAHKGYYYLENFEGGTDNPDQRIQEDINSLVSNTLDLSVGLISSVTTIFAFIYILWTLSGYITLQLGHWGVLRIPGYLVWVSIIYSLIGTYLAVRIGKPLVGLNFEQQRREANFRFAAVDLRSHAEHVALYQGEHHQKNILLRLFSGVLDNWYAIILRQKLLLWFTAGYNQVSVILPLVVVLPNYFGKVFKLGGLLQALRAFSQIQDSLSFFINAYAQIAVWRAVMERLLTFMNRINQVEMDATKNNKFTYNYPGVDKIKLHQLDICTPDGRQLLKNVNQEFVHGQHYLIKGRSGIGKSTIIRAIAGIWPYGSGSIDLPANKNVMYLPQISYMPIGTLKEALLFPKDASHPVSSKELAEILRECDLPHLVARLHDVGRWSETLSPGELQRIAFARILIHKPDWVFLDESTSALDLPHEAQLYQLIKKRLPFCSLISVGHQPSVETFHDHIVDLSPNITAETAC